MFTEKNQPIQPNTQAKIEQIDTLIIGQGLAGSLLAWQLMQQGQKVIIVCDEQAPSASAVAAGIFNPISGQRFVLQAQADRIIPAAEQCYGQLQRQFGQMFFYPKIMLRIFKHRTERQHFDKRRQDSIYRPYLGSCLDNISGLQTPYGLGQQRQTGYLDFTTLLTCLRDYFITQHSYMAGHFVYHDLKHAASDITWRDIHAQRIIFCQGFADQHNPYFKHLPFQPSKGEILTISTKTDLPDHIINGGQWLLPLHSGQYKTGATYSHDLDNADTTASAKAELLHGLQQLLSKPVDIEVSQQQAGIRPNTLDKQPFIGFHPEQQNIGIFNGFGSKGSMLIPYYAQAFANHIRTGSTIPSEADIARIHRRKKKPTRVSLTERVHQSLLAHITPDHIAIDATAGNGHDTLFLAKHIHGSGQVFAFDIQRQAIDNTLNKLKAANINSRVTLHCCGHEQMLKHIPKSLHGKINLIMFNLGYLPHADKSIITQTDTTISALEAAIQLIRADGHISILTYPGHVGGKDESEAVKKWASHLSVNEYTVRLHASSHTNTHAPIWLEVMRQG